MKWSKLLFGLPALLFCGVMAAQSAETVQTATGTSVTTISTVPESVTDFYEQVQLLRRRRPINPQTVQPDQPATICCDGNVNLAAPNDKHPRGRKQPTQLKLKQRHAAAFARVDHRLKKLPKITSPAFDCRTMSWIGQVQDQGQCGSCWDVSACGVITNSYIKAGAFKGDGSFVLSPQYVLDCGQNGGCDGDDAPTVLDMAKSKGLPTTTDYGPYIASPQRCKFNSQKLYTISNWGYCTPDQSEGIAATQDIKNAIAAYGAISSAVAANGDWDNYQGGVMPFRRLSPGDVDHDISIIGWDDTKQAPGSQIAGAFLVLNQWSKTWGMDGCCWIGYGSHQLGTEAAWVVAMALPPTPPTPTPTPPTPGPNPPTPVPPSPTPAPVVNPTTLPPVVGAYLRAQFVHQAIKAGKDRTAAQQYASDVMTDELLAAGLSDAGLTLPNQGKQAPAGGWLQWLITNGPAIMQFITEIIALFGVTGSSVIYDHLGEPFLVVEPEWSLAG